MLIFLTTLIIVLLGADGIAYKLHLKKDPLGSPIVAGIAKHACNREKDLSLKCFDLKGKVYVVSENDSGIILDYLDTVVSSRSLTDNTEFKPIDSKAMSNKDAAISAGSADANTYGMFLITLSYSGGLFGQYHFPYNNNGNALYATSFKIDNEHGDSDYTYILKSEFGTTDDQTLTILQTAKSLQEDKYILMIAEN